MRVCVELTLKKRHENDLVCGPYSVRARSAGYAPLLPSMDTGPQLPAAVSPLY